MDREIRFRAWEPPLTEIGFGKMYNIAFPTWNGNIEVWRNNAPQTETILLPIADEDVVLMQYTGLRDMNGKEIYEGDIWQEFDGKHRCIGVIVYNEDSFDIVWKIENHFNNILRIHKACGNVIGNIYENPELLAEEAVRWAITRNSRRARGE